MDKNSMSIAGAPPSETAKYTPIYEGQFDAGLMTQRSPFTTTEPRWNKRMLGAKGSALLSGLNCEISNKLTLQRRPGLLPYGTASIPAPLAFYCFEQQPP